MGFFFLSSLSRVAARGGSRMTPTVQRSAGHLVTVTRQLHRGGAYLLGDRETLSTNMLARVHRGNPDRDLAGAG
jgi:hypothetical protein